ncbi:MAG: hypothetical protein ACYCSW_06875 [bacterium]
MDLKIKSWKFFISINEISAMFLSPKTGRKCLACHIFLSIVSFELF